MLRNLLVLIFLVLSGCTFDGGYDPSTKYDADKIDYLVKYNESYTVLPECTRKLEGKVFCIVNTRELFVCVEGFWSPKGVANPDDEQLETAGFYRSDSTKSGRNSGYWDSEYTGRDR